MKYEVKGMPSFMKDELKKKDEEKLEEMKREIDEAEAADTADVAEEAADDVRAETAEGSREGTEEAENDADDPVKRAEKLEADLAEKDAQMLRLRADFDNFRRRSAKEREELAAVVTQGILTDMLPLLDNFERALSAEGSDLDSFRAGVSMIYKQNGLEVIDTKDKKFDPNFHQAVMRVQDPEKEDDTIEQELQKGYMAKGRVIRPSMVQVVSN